MKRKWIMTAILCMLVGIAGMAALGFDANQGILGSNNSERVAHEQQWSFAADELQTLKVELLSDDLYVQFADSQDTQGTITLEGRFDQKVLAQLEQAHIQNGQLELIMKPETRISFFNFGIYESNKSTLTIHMPQGVVLSNLDVRGTSGSYNLQDVHADQTSVQLTSGDLNLNNLTADHFTSKMTSGELSILNATANLDLQMTSGDIKVDGLSGEGKVQATSGGVEISQREAGGLDISMKSGDVRIETPVGSQAIYDVRTTSGDIVTPPSSAQAKHIIKVRATSGDVVITN